MKKIITTVLILLVLSCNKEIKRHDTNPDTHTGTYPVVHYPGITVQKLTKEEYDCKIAELKYKNNCK